MQIIFDPSEREDVARVMDILGLDKQAITVTGGADAPTPTSTPPSADPRVGVELDSKGTPWMEEYHAGGKTVNKDGTWRRRRGVDNDAADAAEKAARGEIEATPEPAPQPPVDLPTEDGPVSLKEVVDRYTELSVKGLITVSDLRQIYFDCDTTASDLNVNESARVRVMEAFDHIASRAAPTLPGMPG